MILCCLVGAFAFIGCNGEGGNKPGNGGPSNVPPVSQTPAEKLYGQLHSAVYQLNAALDSIEEALKEAKASQAPTIDLKQSLEEISASIDSAGETLGDEAAEEPDKAKVAADMKAAETRKSKLIQLVNDALHDLRDARGIVDSLASESDAGPLENVGLKIDQAMDDLRGVLEELGGKEELGEISNEPEPPAEK
jgi:hypothetical protein